MDLEEVAGLLNLKFEESMPLNDKVAYTYSCYLESMKIIYGNTFIEYLRSSPELKQILGCNYECICERCPTRNTKEIKNTSRIYDIDIGCICLICENGLSFGVIASLTGTDEIKFFKALADLGIYCLHHLRVQLDGYHKDVGHYSDLINFITLHMDIIGLKDESQFLRFKEYLSSNISFFGNILYRSKYFKIIVPIDMYKINIDNYNGLFVSQEERKQRQLGFNSLIDDFIRGDSTLSTSNIGLQLFESGASLNNSESTTPKELLSSSIVLPSTSTASTSTTTAPNESSPLHLIDTTILKKIRASGTTPPQFKSAQDDTTINNNNNNNNPPLSESVGASSTSSTPSTSTTAPSHNNNNFTYPTTPEHNTTQSPTPQQQITTPISSQFNSLVDDEINTPLTPPQPTQVLHIHHHLIQKHSVHFKKSLVMNV